MNDDINHIPSDTPNFQTQLAEKLAELAPEAIADGKIDVEKLKELLADDADDSNERFGLFWPGKRRALRAAQQPTTATLKPDVENSKDWDTTKNVFIEGDNLEVLKVLQKHYHGKIKMIYIDPPYNTGKDFVYPDNFKEGLDTYLEWTKQVNEEGQKLSTNSESEGRYHSNWLNMMYPRLKLARNLLNDKGAIFLSIDDNEFDNAYKILCEIFGESNHIGTFSVTKAEGGGLAKQMIKGHDYLIAFARKITNFPPLLRPKEIRGKVVDRDGEQYWIQDDWLRKEFGKYGSCPYEEITHYHGQEKLEEVDRGLASGDYVLIPKNGHHIVGRLRKISEDGSKFYSILKHLNKTGIEALANLDGMDLFFDYPKPVTLIRDLVEGATFTTKNEESIILDFFAGSSTTAHAVMQLNAEDGGNRRHIQIQLPEPTKENSAARKAGYFTISELSHERIRRAGEKIRQDFSEQLSQRDTPLDVGFRAYKLSDTNFSKWQVSSDTPTNELEQHLLELRESANDNATPADLFVELLLKQGYSLTEDIGDTSIAGLDLKTVLDADGDAAVLAYLDEHTKPTLDQLREIADSKPVRFVILEDCFQGDDELKTNLVQICKTNGIELWTA